MSVLSDVDIRKSLGKDIVIEPLNEQRITPLGYDLSVGDFVFSPKHGLLEAVDGHYSIPPRSSVRILTKESIWVSGRICGTLHSRVSHVSRGFSHISTTLDPLWYGPLLITITNTTEERISLKAEGAFATLMFHRLRSSTKYRQHDIAFIKHMLLKQRLEDDTGRYIERISSLLAKREISDAFAEKVKAANRPMVTKILASTRALRREKLLRVMIWVLLVSLGVGIATLGLYWEKLSPLFGGVVYDSKITAAQITALIAILAVAVALWRK